MPRFRSFVQNRLARETKSKGGSIPCRRQYPSLDRKLEASSSRIGHKRKDEIASKITVTTQAAAAAAATEEVFVEQESVHTEFHFTAPQSNPSTCVEVRDGASLEYSSSSRMPHSQPSESFEAVESRDDEAYSINNEEDDVLGMEGPVDEEIRENLPLPDLVNFESNSDDDTVTNAEDPSQANEDESTIVTFLDTFSGSMVLDSNVAFLRSKEDIPRLESPKEERDVTVTYSAVSLETEGSDHGALARFLNLFRCTEDGSFENGDAYNAHPKTASRNLLEEARASKTNNTLRFVMASEKGKKASCIDKEEEEEEDQGVEGSPANRSCHESISSAFSSPSRRGRRSVRPKSPLSSDEEVDCMIEIAASNPQETNDPTDQIHELNPVADDVLLHQDHLADGEKREHGDEDDFLGSPPNRTSISSFSPVGPRSITTSCKGRVSPMILRDQDTSLPDNIPPMARLRYCSHIGGKYGLLVTKERCYV